MRAAFVFLFAAACGVLIGAASPSTAYAQATRTWVSGVGDDANPCSRTAPCKTFAGAISKTATDGIIDTLDPGGYGAVTITKSITIRSIGDGGGILAAGTNGIIVNAPGGRVNLIGLNIDGAVSGLNGIRVLAANTVLISDSSILNFRTGTGAGVDVASTAFTKVMIHNTTISQNLVGVRLRPVGGLNTVYLDDAMVFMNNTANLDADTANAKLILNDSFVANTAVSLTNGAELRSFGNNALVGPNPTVTDPLK